MGLYKRHKVWWVSVTRTRKGRQIRRSTKTTDKKLAEKIYAKILTEVAEGKWFERLPGEDKTFMELAQKYEEGPFKETKGWGKTQCYLNQLKAFFGPYTLTEISPAVIDEFKQIRKKEGVKPATINRQLTILRLMLNLAKKRWKWIKEVPTIEMEPKADNKRVRFLSFDEYHRLLDRCNEWLKPIVALAAWTGLRQGNLLHLRRSQVNLFTKTITLEGNETKNNENLIIPITQFAFEVLKETMKTYHLNSPYIFCKEDGTPYHPVKIQRAFKKALKLAGIIDFRFHDLRHCFASWNRQAGVDIDTLTDLMGHKDTRMTRRYAHITPLHLSKALGLLEKSYKEFITNLSQSNEVVSSN